MIAADDCGAACTGVSNGVELDNGIDLKCVCWINCDVVGRQNSVDPVTLTQQQPAHLAKGFGSSQRHNPFDQSA